MNQLTDDKEALKMSERKARRSAEEIFALYYHETRAHLLETAAALDRFDRYDPEGKLQDDPRYRRLIRAAQLLADGDPQRTERFLELFSEGGE